jgi:RNA polymerase sigma factor (sigma-70 family)
VRETSAVPGAEALATLSDVLRQAARVHRLSCDDRDDFFQSVQVKLLETDYEIFRSFQGRSSLRTYLAVVCTRLLLDWRVEQYGRWRPSAAAIRLGEVAILIERLVYRDGHSMEGAIEVASMRDPALSTTHIRRIVDALPPRARRQIVPEDALEQISAPVADDPVERLERQRAASRVSNILARTINALPAKDRLLILGRYGEGRSVIALARLSGDDPGYLYRRCERVLRDLRRTLAEAGVTGPATT